MTAHRRGPLEPEVAAAIQLLKASGRPAFEEMTVDQARAVYRAGRDTVQMSAVPVHEIFDHRFGADPGMAARLYDPGRPGSEIAAAILFFHGGGGVIGDLDTHDSICRRLANASARTVVAIDYRLGPENKFPAAPEDAIAAYAALVAEAHALRIDPDDIVIAGDSAGGALALVAAMAAANAGLPPAAALVLFYPVVDLRGGTVSYAEVDDVPTTRRTMKWFCDHYLASPADADNWRASPLLATLDHVPPTFVTSAGHDPLCDEAFVLVERLRGNGVRCEHRHLPGQIHGYLTLGRLIGEAQRSIDAAAVFMRNSGGAAELACQHTSE